VCVSVDDNSHEDIWGKGKEAYIWYVANVPNNGFLFKNGFWLTLFTRGDQRQRLLLSERDFVLVCYL
jgi:hypothetical protein